MPARHVGGRDAELPRERIRRSEDRQRQPRPGPEVRQGEDVLAQRVVATVGPRRHERMVQAELAAENIPNLITRVPSSMARKAAKKMKRRLKSWPPLKDGQHD